MTIILNVWAILEKASILQLLINRCFMLMYVIFDFPLINCIPIFKYGGLSDVSKEFIENTS